MLAPNTKGEPMTRTTTWTGLAAILGLTAAPASAEVVASAPEHFTLQHEAVSTRAPDALWARLIEPSTWWEPSHTYSGNAANLSLTAAAGGAWREDWEGGSIVHGEVLYVKDGEELRLSAPFGPLQAMAVNVVWTITIAPHEEGSLVRFTEVANGTSASGLDRLAPAVDGVKAQALANLVAP